MFVFSHFKLCLNHCESWVKRNELIKKMKDMVPQCHAPIFRSRQ